MTVQVQLGWCGCEHPTPVVHYKERFERCGNCQRRLRWTPLLERPQQRPGRCSLYRLFDSASSLLYVGISLNVAARLSRHGDKEWYPQIARITVEHFPDRVAALAAEAVAIALEGPHYNVAGRPRP